MTTSVKIQIDKYIAVDLALRNSADKFFDSLDLLEQDKIIIDFKCVKSISRSFAHQYYLRKNMSKKTIREVNVPVDVKKMLKIVSEPRPKTQFINSKSSEAICL